MKHKPISVHRYDLVAMHAQSLHVILNLHAGHLICLHVLKPLTATMSMSIQ
jgi:hypothetical protein